MNILQGQNIIYEGIELCIIKVVLGIYYNFDILKTQF